MNRLDFLRCVIESNQKFSNPEIKKRRKRKPVLLVRQQHTHNASHCFTFYFCFHEGRVCHPLLCPL